MCNGGVSRRCAGVVSRCSELGVRYASPGKPRDPFSVALDTLRDRISDGRLVLGEPLTITEVAYELGLSATPVREALSRLAGEGLIEDRRGRGYFARRIDVADLVELYGLRRLYLLAAVEGVSMALPRQAPPEDAEIDLAERIGQVFDHLVAGAGNRAMLVAYRAVCDQLLPAVGVEKAIFPLAEELARFQALVHATPQAWSEAIAEFHAARQAKAGELVRAMRARANISRL